MKPVSVVVLSAVVSAVAAFAVVQLASESSSRAASSPRELVEIESQIRDLAARNTALEKAISDERARPATAEASDRLSAVDIERAVREEVARAIAAREGEAPVAAGAKPAGASAEKAKPKGDVNALLARFADPGLSHADFQKIWNEVRAAGLMDEAVAAIEKLAKDKPSDPDIQTLLGASYLQKLFTVPDGPEKGTWAVKADQAFDAALAANPEHWDARFSKATSLAFWPPIFGKQKDAISNFETLIKQQEATAQPKPQYAEAYVFLGNLYDQQGAHDKAAATFKKGLSLFPDNASLKSAASK
ncbi:MAG TPA: tetratricopeptide repeat protein [Planctomycetota bacterium]|nr:tetratricopeptide repeat protein [Planctomycetota bacterium]